HTMFGRGGDTLNPARLLGARSHKPRRLRSPIAFAAIEHRQPSEGCRGASKPTSRIGRGTLTVTPAACIKMLSTYQISTSRSYSIANVDGSRQAVTPRQT